MIDADSLKDQLKTQLHVLSTVLPKFEDGRIDYTNATEAPVVNIVVMYNERMLLLKRSDQVLTYKGMWNCVGGYIDSYDDPDKFVIKELEEELGILESDIMLLELGIPIIKEDKSIPITWHIYPYLVTLASKPEIILDYEHTECAWIDPVTITEYETVPGLEKLYDHLTSEDHEQ